VLEIVKCCKDVCFVDYEQPIICL